MSYNQCIILSPLLSQYKVLLDPGFWARSNEIITVRLSVAEAYSEHCRHLR